MNNAVVARSEATKQSRCKRALMLSARLLRRFAPRNDGDQIIFFSLNVSGSRFQEEEKTVLCKDRCEVRGNPRG